MKDLVAAVIVFLSTLTLTSLIRSHQTLLENQQLVAENIRNRYEALKNQLNPHFLFNSLNTLDGLIGFDDEKAHNYLQNLSSSFRYTIQNKEIITLIEELQFVESYCYLMKIRYGDNLTIQYAVNEKYNEYFIMPVSLQLLIENAIKHNVINDKHPLTIGIETTENDTIKVSNAIQPKINDDVGEGIGLVNLMERYRLLFGMDVIITKNETFGVEIPLIEGESRMQKAEESLIINH
jgi:LytS/YehU family sensor histidine kinase